MSGSLSVSDQMQDILKEYMEDLTEAINEGLEETGRECVDDLKATSPKNTGEYSKGWKIKKMPKLKSVIVYNSLKPGLTHLLELGHDVFNSKGERVGRARSHPHIKPACDKAGENLVDNIKKNLP